MCATSTYKLHTTFKASKNVLFIEYDSKPSNLSTFSLHWPSWKCIQHCIAKKINSKKAKQRPIAIPFDFLLFCGRSEAICQVIECRETRNDGQMTKVWMRFIASNHCMLDQHFKLPSSLINVSTVRVSWLKVVVSHGPSFIDESRNSHVALISDQCKK